MDYFYSTHNHSINMSNSISLSKNPINQIIDNLFDYPRHLLVLKITLLLLLLHAKTSWGVHMPVRIACILMLSSDKLTTNKFLWGIITALMIYVNFNKWYIIDNHQYLITYWSAICLLSLFQEDILYFLSKSATYLIGLTFCFATIWKIIGLEYFDGSFLFYTLLTDGRLKLLAILGGGLTESELAYNSELMNFFYEFCSKGLSISLKSNQQVIYFSIFLSYLTILLEGGIGITFLFSKYFKKYKDGFLLAFIFGTYFLIPVLGFGFLLSILGITQISLKNKNLFGWYIAALIIMQLTLIPIDQFIIDFMN